MNLIVSVYLDNLVLEMYRSLSVLLIIGLLI